ncbi:hypothetical protein M422DRAFT_49444 [Sphaerobolus stellatus SS14]|uniref:Protein kinase domain-containing protein n=1 Tax=Sphaerobolus stellatus (strain SS14) TaxID=990650 RepID=A0A0C9UYK9_SPHS4|nr:hypothetical protein M422DRAFT_49444 [Sphaerobolus stellatus SS14]
MASSNQPKAIQQATNPPPPGQRPEASNNNSQSNPLGLKIIHTYQQSQTTLRDWLWGVRLGKGSFGIARVATHKASKRKAVVKISSLRRDDFRRHCCPGTGREATVMKLLSGHPNIAKLYDYIETPDYGYIIQEFANGGNLHDYLYSKKREYALSASEALVFFKQLMFGIEYAHSFDISHCDIKPHNLVLDGRKRDRLKIIDWGLATVNYRLDGELHDAGFTTQAYSCPERYLRKKGFDAKKGDIWSCGVVLYELLCRTRPFKNWDSLRLGRFRIPPDMDPLVSDLIRKMLEVNPNKRITIAEIYRHPYFCQPTKVALPYSRPEHCSTLEISSLSPSPIDERFVKEIANLYIQNDLFKMAKERQYLIVKEELVREGPTLTKFVYNRLLAFSERPFIPSPPTPNVTSPAAFTTSYSKVTSTKSVMDDKSLRVIIEKQSPLSLSKPSILYSETECTQLVASEEKPKVSLMVALDLFKKPSIGAAGDFVTKIARKLSVRKWGCIPSSAS